MLDIVHNTKSVLTKAKKLGIAPLIIGKDVTLVKTVKELRKVASLLVLGNANARELIEGPIDGVVELELLDKKDHLHYRRAGLSEVHAKLLAENQKALFLSFSAVKYAANPGQAIGRMKQNAMIAHKKGLPIIPVSMAKTPKETVTIHDLHAFFIAVGIPEQCLKRSQKAFEELVKRAKIRATDAYIGEGVTRVK